MEGRQTDQWEPDVDDNIIDVWLVVPSGPVHYGVEYLNLRRTERTPRDDLYHRLLQHHNMRHGAVTRGGGTQS